MEQKKTPLRKCTGCSEMKSKKELSRVVKNENGEYEVDCTGKKCGRGAYVCQNLNCILKAHKNKGLERSFKSSVPKEVYEYLKKELENKNG